MKKTKAPPSPSLFDLDNPPRALPGEVRPVQPQTLTPPASTGGLVLEVAPVSSPLPPIDTPIQERPESPNDLCAAHPYKGPGVADGDKMAPSKWAKPAKTRADIPAVACSLYYAIGSAIAQADSLERSSEANLAANKAFLAGDEAKVEQLCKALVSCGLEKDAVDGWVEAVREVAFEGALPVWRTFRQIRGVGPKLLRTLGYDLAPGEWDGYATKLK